MISSLFSDRWRFLGLITPARIRYGLLLLWSILCINNMKMVISWLGFDLAGHLEYIQFIADRHQLPLAIDGWTMFQSPLFYLICAPFYSLLRSWADVEKTVCLLRFIPMLCGLAQIEICYRAARRVFPDEPEAQVVATVVGGWIPMNVYSSQYLGNEPLAGVLTALTLLLMLRLLDDAAPPRRLLFFVMIGAVWGLAMLAKVSSILLTPVLISVIALSGWRSRAPVGRTMTEGLVVLGTAALVSGWYYLRNLYYLGRPFVGGWDQDRNVDWWQDPGYRTWSQLFSEGRCLTQPVYSGYWSLPDSLYSTLWTDGSVSGCSVPLYALPWNISWLNTLSWLSIAPSLLLLLGILFCWRHVEPGRRMSLILCLTVVGMYLIAIVDLWIQLPIYSTAKSSYMLGTVPCLGLLAGSGANLIDRNIWLRALMRALLACWLVAVFVAFFCVHTTNI